MLNFIIILYRRSTRTGTKDSQMIKNPTQRTVPVEHHKTVVVAP